MTADQTGLLRLTVLGCSTVKPHPGSPASGYLVEWGSTAIMLDAGLGTIRRLQRVLDPLDLSALIVGHMHADHYLDMVGLRYLYSWGEATPVPLPIHLPPGGRSRIDQLAVAVSERPHFFDAAFDLTEYDPDVPLHVGPLTVRFINTQHYVPAWGVIVEAPDGARLAYTGDTGPSDVVIEAVRGVDLLLVESALESASQDDPRRGHLTPEEAIDLAARAEVRQALLVHYAPARRAEIASMCASAGPWIRPAVAGLTVTVKPPTLGATADR